LTPVSSTIFDQYQALAADPLVELERTAADDVAREVLAPSLGHLARHRGSERHRELMDEDRIGLGQPEDHREGIGRFDSGDVRRLTGDKIRRAHQSAVVLRALRAEGRAKHALDRIFEVGAGYRTAVAEARVAAQMEGEQARVGRHFPGEREVRHQVDAGVAVAHQRIENHLLELPRRGIVTGHRVERRRVVGRGNPQHRRTRRYS
jgi:hypothetical protein